MFFSFLSMIAVSVYNIYQTEAGYESMTCYEDSSYQNSMDGALDAYKNNYFFNGQESYHSNHYEDRQFKWRYCRPSNDGNPFESSWWFPQTDYDDEWIRGCGGNAAITRAKSSHDNGKEDRIWDIRCHEIDQDKYSLTDCSWTSSYQNWYDNDVDYDCSNNGVMRGIESYHHNHYEDRRWKFECCRVQSNIYEFPDMACIEDSTWENDWDGVHDYNTRYGYFLNGQISAHNNHYEDRLFKWRYCKPNTVSSAITGSATLTTTSYDGTWTESCDHLSDGHAAMIGGYSVHDNGKEDRIWTFQCGTLDTSLYRLVNCGYTGYLSNWDDDIDFDCPHDGVIRSIWSKHDNGKEDRLWKFECCTIAMVDYSFDSIIGSWYQITSCGGCPSIEYTVSVGIEQSQVETVSTEYTESLEVSIATGFEFSYGIASGSVEVTVTGSVSQTTSSSMESALSITQSESLTLECDKQYFYQWKVDASVSVNGIGAGDVTVSSDSNYICTDIQYPQCVLGTCIDDDCQTCRG